MSWSPYPLPLPLPLLYNHRIHRPSIRMNLKHPTSGLARVQVARWRYVLPFLHSTQQTINSKLVAAHSRTLNSGSSTETNTPTSLSNTRHRAWGMNLRVKVVALLMRHFVASIVSRSAQHVKTVLFTTTHIRCSTGSRLVSIFTTCLSTIDVS